MVLRWLLLWPLIGMVAILLMPRRAVGWIRRTALIATGLTLVVAVQMLQQFQPHLSGIQLEEKAVWITAALAGSATPLRIAFFLGVDGISVPLILLTALLGFLACMGSWGIRERHKEYFVLYLLLEIGMLGTFLALDLFLFYVFWEIVLVPMYFLIGIWGGGRREYSAFKFFVYTLTGSLVMLLAVLALYLRTGTFDMVALSRMGHTLEPALQRWLFVGFFLGFAVKVPIFPFHTWLPDAHVDAPTPGSVLLAGVLLKMGGYGFFRIAYPMFPDAAQWAAGGMALLGTINIVYGALVALAQTDFKKLVAYSSVSHMGFVLLGLAALTPEGLSGAMFQMVSHGLISGALFLLVGVVYERTHTRDLAAFGGLGATMPVYAGFLVFFSLASLGLPGLSGFVAEFLSLLGAYLSTVANLKWFVAVSVLGIVFAAAYMLKVIRQVLLGPPNPQWKAVPDMTWWERWTLIPLLAGVLALGVAPLLLLRLQDATLQQLVGYIVGR